MFVLFYMNNEYATTKITIPQEIIIKSDIYKVAKVDEKKLFNVMANITNYPKILPDNYVKVRLINQTNNTIYTEEVVVGKGIKTKVLVKHMFFPFSKHVMELLDGDAKGSIIVATYEKNETGTHVHLNIEAHLHGLFIPLGNVIQYGLESMAKNVINSFIEYTEKN